VCVCVCVCRGGARTLACVCARVALLIYKEKRRHVMSKNVAAPHLSTLSHKRHDFREKFVGHKMCGLIFAAASV
jgi:hypothetical protein